MSDAPLRYAVLLQKLEQLDPPKVAEALSAHHKIPFQDAARQSRSSWGIVGDDMEEQGARNLAAKLQAAGLGGVVLPRNLLEEPPPPLETSQAELDNEAIRILPKSGEKASLLWSRLALLAATAFKIIRTKTIKKVEGPSPGQKAASLGLMMVTGLPISIGGKKREVEKTQESSDLVYYLDLYERKPLRHFRIDAQHFNYSCLGERMQYGSAENFRTLIETIAQRAPGCVRNRGAQMLLERKQIHTMGYDSLEDLDRESRWLLTLEALRDP